MRPIQNSPVVIPSLHQQAWESLVLGCFFEIATGALHPRNDNWFVLAVRFVDSKINKNSKHKMNVSPKATIINYFRKKIP